MGRLSERNYRLTPVTIDMVDGFPSWMKLKQPDSNGFGFFNAFGVEFERARRAIDWADSNLELSTAYRNEVSSIYKVEYPFLFPEQTEISATAVVGTTPASVSVSLVDERTFFWGPATRITNEGVVATPSSIFPSGIYATGIIGLEFVTGLPESPSGSYWVTFDVSNGANVSGVAVFDSDWNLIKQYAYGVGEQNYESAGTDEILYPESSSYLYSLYQDDPNSNPYGSGVYNKATGTLERMPISGTVKMFDMLNLDAYGNATEVYPSGNSPSGYASGLLWSVSGNVWEFTNPQSRYIATYQYLDYDKTTFLSYPNKKDHISEYVDTGKYNGRPLTTIIPTGYTGAISPASLIESPGVGLRIDPTILRPGNTAEVEFTYWNTATGYWPNPTGAPFSLTITDPYFNRTEEDNIIVGKNVYNMEVVTYYTSPTISGNYVHIPASSVFGSTPLNVSVAYEAKVTFSPTGVASYGVSGVNPYPYDYQIITKDKQYLKPYTVLPLSHSDPYISGALTSGKIADFSTKVYREYAGIAFSDDQDVMINAVDRTSIYVYERNNQVLVKKRGNDQVTVGIWALFCPDQTASGYISHVIPSGMTLIKKDQVLDQANKQHTRFLYRDVYGDYIDKLDTPYFHLLPYEMHTSIEIGPSGYLVPTSPVYRDIRGIVFHDGKLYMVASEAYNQVTWDPSIGVYGPASSEPYMCRGHIYAFDCANLINGTDNVRVELSNPNFDLGEEYNDPRDITLDEEENLLIANGDDVVKFNLHYDYATASPDQSSKSTTVYFREEYISISNIKEE